VGAEADNASTSTSAAWEETMLDSPVRQTGCFVVKFPSTVWQQVACHPVTEGPFAPSTQPTIQASTIQPFAGGGGGNDYVANSPTTIIGKAVGEFVTSGIKSESDSKAGKNRYSLQINSNFIYNVATQLTDYKTTKAWEQFVYDNWDGVVFIEYWLFDYANTYQHCPTYTIPNQKWHNDGYGDCWENDNGLGGLQEVPPTQLSTVVMSASADYLGSGNDQVIFCTPTACGLNGWVDGALDLYQNWVNGGAAGGGGNVEFNVFGAGGGSMAKFNSGTSIQVSLSLYGESGKSITPVCGVGGITLESNNLNLQTAEGCSVVGQGMSFWENNFPHDTMTVSYSTPGGAGPTGAPTFKYVDETGNAATYTLTNTPTALWVGRGKASAWSVTPNPLVGSNSAERWMSGQTLKGIAATETLNFAFYHQYLQTLYYSVAGGGSPSAPSFTANQFGASASQVLTLASTGYWFDYDNGYGTSWSVTNPLGGSSASEQWVTSQATTGQITWGQTIAFTYQHQYYLTMKVSPLNSGGVSPSSGWQNADAQVSINAGARPGYKFLAWKGTGAGSYSGSKNPVTITMTSAITETAIFVQLPP